MSDAANGTRMFAIIVRAFAVFAIAVFPLPAAAWGAQGHRIISGAAMSALPASLPAFLRSPEAHDEVALLGPEADRIKGAGLPQDGDENPAHYVDALDDGTVRGLPLAALPRDEKAYDDALRAASPPSDLWSQGYLPYAIADGWQRVVRDFAYWRADRAGEARAASAADRAFFMQDRRVREAVTLRDIGYWSHFVADGSQPLHVTVHFNGWDGNGVAYSNPRHYSDSRTIHSRFETALVHAVASEPLVAARLPAPQRADGPILAQVGAYLLTTARFVPAVYDLEARGEIDAHDRAATSLVLDRLAAGAAETRDLLVSAWDAAAGASVGYPPVAVRDLERGAVAPTRANTGFGD